MKENLKYQILFLLFSSKKEIYMVYLRMEVFHMRVVRVEEITNLVGMDSYIASLSLDETKLIQKSVEPLENTDLKVIYQYEDKIVEMIISRDMIIRIKINFLNKMRKY